MSERKARQQEELRGEIRAAARALMTEHGTAGISIRAVARALDLTPAALYYYYASLDDIVTALIVEGYHALAEALADALPSGDTCNAETLLLLAERYRAWALQHPTDFQLLFGNPIPGYVAPREQTVPAVVRMFGVVVSACENALEAGAVQPPTDMQDMPPGVLAHIQAQIERQHYPARPLAFYVSASLIATMHGLVILELMRQLQPTIGDTEAFFRQQMRQWLRAVGGLPAP